MLKHINIRLKKGRKKLGYKKLESYIINRKFGPIAYKLNLPQDLKINLISHINNLEKWTPPVEGQPNPEGHATVVDGETQWEVNAIINSEEYPEEGF